MFHKRLLQEFQCNRKYVAGMVAAQWVSLCANVAMTGATAAYLHHLSQRADRKAHTGLFYVLLLVLAIAVRCVMTCWENRMSVQASGNVKKMLREKVYARLMELGAGYRDTVTTSEAVQVSTEGVEQLEIYFGKYVPQFFFSLLAPLTLFCIVSPMSIKAAAVLFLCVPLIPLSIVAVQKFAKKMLHKYWGSYTGLGDTFLEGLRGLTTLKVYRAEEDFAGKMDKEAENFRKITMRVLIMQLNSISIMDLVAYGGAALGIVISVLELRAGRLGTAQCFFIMLVSAEFFLPLRRLGSFFHIAMNGNAAADKIFHLLDMEKQEPGCALPDFACQYPLALKEVSFGYASREQAEAVVRDISLEIGKYTFTAVVGRSGCGKSTLASLMMGEKETYGGSILIGGCEASDVSRQEIYRHITRVRHDSYLFAGTVEENLRMGRPGAARTEIESALKKVGLYETIREKGGLSMKLTEKAANLSGGQKQRLALARAILHDSDIYIFDEATSNVDAESENKIMEVIEELAQTKTVILISHRLANVRNADRILFMENGVITEQGSHKMLLEKQGSYRALYERQKELEKYASGERNVPAEGIGLEVQDSEKRNRKQ